MHTNNSTTGSPRSPDPLSRYRLPGRLTVSDVARILGFSSHDIPVLVSKKLLEPLGRPSPNAPKYFAAVEIIARSENPAWLAKATSATSTHWRTKNLNKTKNHETKN